MEIVLRLSPELEALIREVLLAKAPPKRAKKPQEEPPAVPQALEGLDLYRADQRLCRAWGDLMAGWKSAFPGLDVCQQVKLAHAWELANPKNQKVDRPRFLHSWLQRSNDRPRRADPIDALANDLGGHNGGAGHVHEGRPGILPDHPW